MERSILSRLETSLANGDLDELIDVLDAEGHSQLDILDAFYQLCEKLREENRDTEEDFVNDVMDTIVGWGNPDNWHHFSRPYTKEEKEIFNKQAMERWRKKFKL